MTYPFLPLRRSFRIINGGTPTPEPENWGGEIPWATPVGLGATGLTIERTERSLTEAGLASGSKLAPADIILISTRAPIGHLAVCAVAMAFNQGCRALAPIGHSDSRFFAFQLMAERSNLELAGQGSTFLELSSEALATFRVSAPPIEEQRRIADFLDDQVARLDRAVALRKQQEALLDEHYSGALDRLYDGSRHDRQPVPLGRLLAQRPCYGVLVPRFVPDGIPFCRVNALPALEAGVTPDVSISL